MQEPQQNPHSSISEWNFKEYDADSEEGRVRMLTSPTA